MSTSKQTMLIALMVAIGFIAGYGVNYFYQSPVSVDWDMRKACAPEYQRAMSDVYNRLIANGKAEIAAFGFGFQSSPTIAGEVKEVKDKMIVLTVSPMNALADPALKEREIDLLKAKVYRYRQKTIEESQRDQEEFMNKMEQANQDQAGAPLSPPEPFAKDEVSFDNIKVGDRITVTAKSDIHDQKTFIAEEVVLEMNY